MPRDPAHPWVGESVAHDFANPITGAPFGDFGDAIRYRVRDDSTGAGLPYSTITDGDSFIAGFFDSEMLLSGDPVEAAFVVVCSGDGTLRLSGGYDPDWTLDDPADASIPFGDFTVGPTDGEVQCVGTFPTFDVDEYLAQSRYTIGLVECIDGEVTINQVKLRLWPPDGPPGGFATVPVGYTEAVAVQPASVGQIDGPGALTTTGVDTGIVNRGGADTAWDDTALDLEELMLPDANRHVVVDPTTPTTISAGVDAQHSVGEVFGGGSHDGYAAGLMTGSLVLQPDPLEVMRQTVLSHIAGTYGVDFVWSPDEVPGDMPVKVLTAPTTAWDEAATLTTTGWTERPDGPGLGTYWHVTEWDVQEWEDDAPNVVLPLVEFPPNVVPDLGNSTSLDLPDARLVLISLSHDSFRPLDIPDPYAGDPGYDRGVQAIVLADIGPSTVTVPVFQYWQPSLVATRVPPLRQRNRDTTRARLRASRQRSIRARGYL
jgi:hypothetical protein